MISLMIFIGASICLLSHTGKGQDYNSCGTRSVNMRGRIIGGLQSRPGMWPWQVAIYRGVEKKFHCGGALINSRWILSAAHCFHSATNEKFKYTITAGDFNISSKDPHEQERNALKIHLHPDYDYRSYENDIALVELDKGVKMGLYIRTICLPKANENVSVPGKVGSVAGWGWTGRRKPSPVLLHSSYRIQTNEQCDQATNYPFNLSVMFCAGDGKGGNDTCKGDSGGSLVRQLFRDGTYRWVTVGLVSWGEGCARRHKYGYYTRMEPFVAWIQKKMNGSALSCGNPGNIPHGTMIGSDFLVGFTVKYTCSEGYQLRGKSKIRCKRNGKWTRAPTCQKAECRDPGEPRYGVRRPRKSKYFYKDKVRFRCQKNYTIIGRSIIVCQSDGMWDRYKPVCLAPCKDPGVPEGGVRLDHSFRHSETVRFLCTENNERQGLHLRICSNGRWDRTIPTCRVKKCTDPGVPTNGQRNGNDFSLKKKVYFSCNRGFRRVGPEYLQCQSNRKWSDKLPTCQSVECRDPGTPRNGVRRPDKIKYIFADQIDFQCRTNYTLRGYRSITCQKDKVWSGSLPQCLAPCRDPQIPIRGRRLQHSFLHNSVVQFRCNEGWTMEGSHAIRCNNGRWDRDPPTCTVECRDPGTPRNGVRILDKNKYMFEDRIDFQCRTNYKLRGDRSITCQKDKTWSGSAPQCLAPCRDPGTPSDGQRVGNSFLHGNEVRFSCRQGWNIEGSQTIICNDGRWNQPTPECLECGSALGMENRKILDGNIRASSTRDPYRHTAKEGRLNGPRAWCSGSETQPYLEIDFSKPYRITGLATQGSAYDNRWVRWYSLKSNLAGSTFVAYREYGNTKLFEGNKDTNTHVKQKLRNPFIARRLQIHPIKQGGYHTYPACMRVEIYGCDLPLDCVVARSRVVAKWISLPSGMYIYLKAYLTNIGKRYWRVDLENENHDRLRYKLFPKYTVLPFVLDVPPKHEELQVGTRVLAPWGYRYFTGTIRRTRVHRYNRYQVRADDYEVKYFTVDQIRLLKAPRFCE